MILSNVNNYLYKWWYYFIPLLYFIS